MYGIELIYLPTLVLPENSEILIENAISKAKAAAEQCNMLALGDDSGIFIEELDYFPGVHSRRWTGDESDDSGRNEKIIEMLKNAENRSAFLISRFALVDPNGNILGKYRVKNKFNIAKNERGSNGFGYDKILELYYDESEFVKIKNIEQLEEAFTEISSFNHIPTVGELTQNCKNKWNQRGFILASAVKKTMEELNYGK